MRNKRLKDGKIPTSLNSICVFSNKICTKGPVARVSRWYLITKNQKSTIKKEIKYYFFKEIYVLCKLLLVRNQT